MMYAFVSLGFTALLLILSLLFRIAGKLRLTLPFAYFLLIATILNPWAAAHETLALGILLILVLLSAVRWLFSFKEFLADRRYYRAIEEDMLWQLNRTRDQGISQDAVYFDSQGNLHDKASGNIIDS